jgi:hypothetical protein
MYVLEQRTGFCSYFWTGTGFNRLVLLAKRWRTVEEAQRVKAEIERGKTPVPSPLEVRYVAP